ncbi:MAG: hypothetical protein B7Y90_12355 [Alphaproteobacteria bacterium 32-64-14]|nr:MAG: hypothetical protein B7Y90_12355 [Alphaproteobacteria bacterium 32-64-14]
MLAKLRHQPLDRGLDRVTFDINQRLAERAAIAGQTWRLRTVAMALLVTGGAVVSASTDSAVAVQKSPFAAWSQLAPSTLLEPSK